MASQTESRWRQAIGEEEKATRGTTAEIRDFDPRSAMKEQARAQFETFREDLSEDMMSLRGQQVGQGRLKTGFGYQDQDRFVRDRLDRLDRALANNALAANAQLLRKYGLQSQNRGRFFDMMSGQLDRETAEANAKKQMWGDIAGSVGGVLGAAIPFL